MEEKENIKLAFFLNLGFSIFELIGGLLTNSVSIFSDAIHDFGDAIAIGCSYLLEKLSNKEKNNTYTYGYRRYSIISAIITSTILIIGSLLIFFNAFIRFFSPSKINLVGMFVFGIFGLAINGYATYKTSKSSNLNEKSVNLHMMEDVLGWIAVLIGSLLIKITGWTIIDPLLSISIALLVCYKAIKNVTLALDIILEKTPNNINIEEIKENICELSNISDVHHIHVWTIDGESIFLTMHVLIKRTVTKKTYEKVKKDIKERLLEKKITHSTIEMEYEDCDDLDCLS